MKIIAHRGNLCGPSPKLENNPDYIECAMSAGFYVEVDLWNIKNEIWFGHDGPQYRVMPEYFTANSKFDPLERIYFHCKNLQALMFCSMLQLGKSGCKYFTHDKDPYTLTSDGFIWTYPDSRNELSIFSIPVVYDRNSSNWRIEDLARCEGICTDDTLYYDRLFNAALV